MKYCTHCGAEVLDEAEICVNCGCRVESQRQNSENGTLGTIAKVFMILATVLIGLSTCGIGLAWCIPMTNHVRRSKKTTYPLALASKFAHFCLLTQFPEFCCFATEISFAKSI